MEVTEKDKQSDDINEVLLNAIIALAQKDIGLLNKDQCNYLKSCRNYRFEETGQGVEYCFTLREWRNIDALC